MQSTPPFFDIPILKKLLNYMLHHKVLYCDGLCCLSIHFPYDPSPVRRPGGFEIRRKKRFDL